MLRIPRWTSAVALAMMLATSATTTLAKKHPEAPRPAVAVDATQKVGDKYPTVDMHKSKVGDDKSAGVIYLDPAGREERRLVIRGGLVYDHTGRPIDATTGKHDDENNYVMDAAGNFYLFDEFTTKKIRHSSIFGGGPVAGAGNIKIVGGRVVYVDSDSGHYPSKKVFENVLKELAACGVDTSGLGK